MSRAQAAMPKSWRYEIAKRDGNNCALCGKPIGDINYATLDHIIPRHAGGSDTIDNLQLAHYRCNVDRGAPITREMRMAVREGRQLAPEPRAPSEKERVYRELERVQRKCAAQRREIKNLRAVNGTREVEKMRGERDRYRKLLSWLAYMIDEGQEIDTEVTRLRIQLTLDGVHAKKVAAKMKRFRQSRRKQDDTGTQPETPMDAESFGCL